jgi:putative transposase
VASAPLGGEKTGPNPTDRGKSGVKRSVLTEGHRVPIGVTIEGAQRHDMKLVRPTIEGIIIECPESTGEQPQGMCLDKGYDSNEARDILREFGFTAHIRASGEEVRALKSEAEFKARSYVVERTYSWMNRFRRLLVRSRQKASKLPLDWLIDDIAIKDEALIMLVCVCKMLCRELCLK